LRRKGGGVKEGGKDEWEGEGIKREGGSEERRG